MSSEYRKINSEHKMLIQLINKQLDEIKTIRRLILNDVYRESKKQDDIEIIEEDKSVFNGVSSRKVSESDFNTIIFTNEKISEEMAIKLTSGKTNEKIEPYSPIEDILVDKINELVKAVNKLNEGDE